MVDQVRIQESINPDGTVQDMRGDRLGAAVVTDLRGRYAEMTSRGRVFSAMLLATTTNVAAGNITGAAAAASTQFALWNPLGSSVKLEILKAQMGVISGTPVGGPMFHNLATIAPTLAGVGGTNCLVQAAGLQTNSQGRVQSSAAGSALTGGGALTALRPMVYDFSAGAFASLAGGAIVEENVDGSIILMPGTMWVPCWQAAGTSLLNSYGVTWMETPLP